MNLFESNQPYSCSGYFVAIYDGLNPLGSHVIFLYRKLWWFNIGSLLKFLFQSHLKAKHLMTFNMHMDNKTYKEPKVSKVTPIKDFEGQDNPLTTTTCLKNEALTV